MPNEPLYQFYETLPGGDIIGGVGGGDVDEGDVRLHDVSGSTTADHCRTSYNSSTPCQTRLSSG